MNKTLALALVLVFLTASSTMVAMPVSGATADENTWAAKAMMHQARSGLGVEAIDNKIYAFGGKDKSGTLASNEEYDPRTNSWTIKTPMPIPSWGLVTAVCQNKIYSLGAGINQAYSPLTDKWENKTPLHILIAQANTVNDKIYIIGGFPNYTSNEVYDPATDTWTTMAPMPKAGAIAASAVFDGKIYFFGGIYENGYVTLTEIYDPASDNWNLGTGAPTYITSGSTAAAVTSGVMAPKQIYVFSQLGNQVYDPKNDSWIEGVVVPTSRQGFGVTVVNDTMYVIGGYNISPLNYLPQPDSKGSIYEGGIITYYDTVDAYTPFGYGTVPPIVSLVSPQNENYSSSEVSLNYTVNKPVDLTRYSLDGKENVTINGNTPISGLSNGLHNITIYAQDNFGNIGSSNTISFTIAKPEPESFPVLLVVSASIVAVVAGVGVGWLLYRRKRRREATRV